MNTLLRFKLFFWIKYQSTTNASIFMYAHSLNDHDFMHIHVMFRISFIIHFFNNKKKESFFLYLIIIGFIFAYFKGNITIKTMII